MRLEIYSTTNIMSNFALSWLAPPTETYLSYHASSKVHVSLGMNGFILNGNIAIYGLFWKLSLKVLQFGVSKLWHITFWQMKQKCIAPSRKTKILQICHCIVLTLKLSFLLTQFYAQKPIGFGDTDKTKPLLFSYQQNNKCS